MARMTEMPAVKLDLISFEKLMDRKDVAGITGVSAAMIKKMDLNGSGPPMIRIGNRVRYRPSGVYTWLESLAVRQPKQAEA
jgi:predicted DNA-binding transcriptional regulator AlpA